MDGVKISGEDIQSVLTQGNLLLERALDEGKYGIVVSGRDIRIPERRSAIKLMKVQRDEEKIKYQRRELVLLTEPRLSHKNIIRYYSWWEHSGLDILAIQMELCVGSLNTILRNNPQVIKAIQEGRFYKVVFPQILNGLDFIHSLGWVHRDIHPGNILIADTNNPQQVEDILIKIADFGLARYIGPAGHPELNNLSEMGPNAFRAPEISTKNYDNKVDLYSSGIVLYRLSGQVTPKDIKQLRSSAAKTRLRQDARLLGLDDKILLDLLVDLLKTEPEERPSARQCSQNLKKSLESVPSIVVRREGDKSYCRCYIQNESFKEFQEEISNLIGIQPQNQTICQETCDDTGCKLLLKVTCDKDLIDMLRKAERYRKPGLKARTERLFVAGNWFKM